MTAPQLAMIVAFLFTVGVIGGYIWLLKVASAPYRQKPPQNDNE